MVTRDPAVAPADIAAQMPGGTASKSKNIEANKGNYIPSQAQEQNPEETPVSVDLNLEKNQPAVNLNEKIAIGVANVKSRLISEKELALALKDYDDFLNGNWDPNAPKKTGTPDIPVPDKPEITNLDNAMYAMAAVNMLGGLATALGGGETASAPLIAAEAAGSGTGIFAAEIERYDKKLSAWNEKMYDVVKTKATMDFQAAMDFDRRMDDYERALMGVRMKKAEMVIEKSKFAEELKYKYDTLNANIEAGNADRNLNAQKYRAEIKNNALAMNSAIMTQDLAQTAGLVKVITGDIESNMEALAKAKDNGFDPYNFSRAFAGIMSDAKNYNGDIYRNNIQKIMPDADAKANQMIRAVNSIAGNDPVAKRNMYSKIAKFNEQGIIFTAKDVIADATLRKYLMSENTTKVTGGSIYSKEEIDYINKRVEEVKNSTLATTKNATLMGNLYSIAMGRQLAQLEQTLSTNKPGSKQTTEDVYVEKQSGRDKMLGEK